MTEVKDEMWIYYIVGEVRFKDKTFCPFNFDGRYYKPSSEEEADQLIASIQQSVMLKVESSASEVKSIKIQSINRIG